MKTKTFVSMLLVLAAVFAGCAGSEVKKGAQADEKSKLTGEYMARAQQQESQGDLVEALESYKLALTVDPAVGLCTRISAGAGRQENELIGVFLD